jgi:hypothetical protein
VPDLMGTSLVAGVYVKPVDRESACERLKARSQSTQERDRLGRRLMGRLSGDFWLNAWGVSRTPALTETHRVTNLYLTVSLMHDSTCSR